MAETNTPNSETTRRENEGFSSVLICFLSGSKSFLKHCPSFATFWRIDDNCGWTRSQVKRWRTCSVTESKINQLDPNEPQSNGLADLDYTANRISTLD